ncbi:MAG: DUF6531 domain-containing protein, partial [Pseudomonadales bacterium]
MSGLTPLAHSGNFYCQLEEDGPFYACDQDEDGNWYLIEETVTVGSRNSVPEVSWIFTSELTFVGSDSSSGGAGGDGSSQGSSENESNSNDDCQKSGETQTTSRSIGNPIEVVGGYKTEYEVDYRSLNRLPLTSQRLYRSDSVDVKEFGRGWSGLAIASLNYVENLLYVTLQGRLYVFSYDPTTGYIVIPHEFESGATLSVSGDKWKFTSPSQNTLVFRGGDLTAAGFGRLESLTNIVGDSLSYVYSDGLTRLPSRVAHSSGTQINYQYSTLSGVSCSGYECNKVVNTISTDLGTWDYNYDSSGRLTEVISPEGVTTGYMYDSSHRLIGRTDDNGTRIRWWGYDSNGRANLSRKYGYEEEVTVVYSSF